MNQDFDPRSAGDEPPKFFDSDLPKPPPPPPPSVSSVASSLAEVNVRTMAGDMRALGMKAAPVNTVPGEKLRVPIRTGATTPGLGVTLLILFGLAGFAALLWFYFLPILFSLEEQPAQKATSTTQGISPSPLSPSFFAHESVFEESPDETLDLALGGISSANSLKTFDQQLQVLIAGAKPGSVFFEIEVIGPDSRALGWTELLAERSAPLISNDFWNEHFSPDFTFFVHKNKTGSWPGYVIRLKPDEKILLVQPEILKIENASSSLANLFLTSPGTAKTGFTDAQVIGQPIRTKEWSEGSLSYGWFHGEYLILSTSLEGMRLAIQHF